MGTVSERTKFHKPAPIACVHTHANTKALWIQKKIILALFSQLMKRLSRNVGKDLPQLVMSKPRAAQYLWRTCL